MRVHELAKELGLQSKDLIARIEKLGGTAKNHMSVVDEAMISKLRTAAPAAPAPHAEPLKAAPAKTEAPKPAPAAAAPKVEAPRPAAVVSKPATTAQ